MKKQIARSELFRGERLRRFDTAPYLKLTMQVSSQLLIFAWLSV